MPKLIVKLVFSFNGTRMTLFAFLSVFLPGKLTEVSFTAMTWGIVTGDE
jgi:hypothetical protein